MEGEGANKSDVARANKSDVAKAQPRPKHSPGHSPILLESGARARGVFFVFRAPFGGEEAPQVSVGKTAYVGHFRSLLGLKFESIKPKCHPIHDLKWPTYVEFDADSEYDGLIARKP